jgi:vacuolar-type H+-ATPase subunit C/Vma6
MKESELRSLIESEIRLMFKESAAPSTGDMLKMAIKAVKSTRQSNSVAKEYLKSLAKDLKKNSRDYVDYSQDDWVEDLENWIADRG